MLRLSTLLVVGVISHQWCAALLVGIAHHSFYSAHEALENGVVKGLRATMENFLTTLTTFVCFVVPFHLVCNFFRVL